LGVAFEISHFRLRAEWLDLLCNPDMISGSQETSEFPDLPTLLVPQDQFMFGHRIRRTTMGLLASLLCLSTVLEPLLADDGPLSAAQIELRLKNSVTHLASDELGGRGIGTPGIEKAANYIADQYRDIGLETNRYQGTPFHTFYLGTRFELGPSNQLSVSTPDGKRTAWALKTDYTPLSLSGSAQLDLPLAFVGFGITAPPKNYDDYAGIDVRNHAVIILRLEPQKNLESSPFDGLQTSDYGIVSHKIMNAISHGASLVILVSDQHTAAPGAPGADGQVKVDPLMDFQVNSTAGNRKIPVVHCRRDAIDALLKASSDKTLSQIESEIDGDLMPRSKILTGYRLAGEVSVIRKGNPLKNVVGVLPGSGERGEETIVVGAHYDHLGMGGMGSLAMSGNAIHNGADDNGSGTASLIEVARELKLRNQNQPLPRRVVFIAFTAEESGLIGSERYVRDPLVPMKDTVAMINMDMVGRLRNEKLTVYGTGTALEFTPMIDRLSAKYEFALIKKPGGTGPSDHASFYARGIPVLHLFTGLHKQYHRPDDDSPLLNIGGMRRISQLVVESIEEIARAERRPTYQKIIGGDEIDGMAEVLLGQDFGGSEIEGPRYSKPDGIPFLGISTRANPDSAAYLVDNVIQNGPAAKAGIRSGDLILKLGADSIRMASEVAPLVKKYKPGDKVKLLINRNGVEVEIEATIGGR